MRGATTSIMFYSLVFHQQRCTLVYKSNHEVHIYFVKLICLPVFIMFYADVLYAHVFTHVHYVLVYTHVFNQQWLPPDMCLTNYKLTDGRGITINVMQSRILWRIWECCGRGNAIVVLWEIKMERNSKSWD